MEVRLAASGDTDRIRDIAWRAYEKYIPRIGREPAPMVADFDAHIERGEVSVVETEAGIIGYLVAYARDADYFVENVAVDSGVMGAGVGKALMAHAEAEARKHGREAIRLYTNVHMHENFSFYAALGYRRTHEVTEAGFRRVYFKKVLERT